MTPSWYNMYSSWLVSTDVTTFPTSVLSSLVVCSDVVAGTPDSLSKSLQTLCTVLTERAAICSALSVKFALMDIIVSLTNHTMCSL